jgi:outer membrane receptor protein involved in Fe transport
MEADGVDWQEAYDGTGQPLPELSVRMYSPSYDKDRFENTALTINGRIDQLKIVYSGAYLDRTADQLQSYTDYSRGVYVGYYQCDYPGYPFNAQGKPTTTSPGRCFSPSAFWTDHQNSTHQSHEVRISTPDDWRVRALGGLFYEEYKIHENTDWFYGTSPNFTPIGPPTEDAAGNAYPVTSNNPNVRPPGDVFFDDITRGYKQKAAFGSVDFDLIPKTLTLTLGTRYYNLDSFEVGSSVGSFGCEIGGPYDGSKAPNPCINSSNFNNLNSKHLDSTYSGFRSRGNLSWHITRDALLYYTWSQGFRPGGFNRAASAIAPNSPLYGIFTPPLTYAPDTLINNELGWKTEWLNHRLQWNSAVYREDWKNTQISIFDPGVTGDLNFTTNGPNYRVNGFETSFVARLTQSLTLTGSAAWNSSEIVKTLSLVSPKTGLPIDIVNPFGALGSPLSQSPPFAGNIRARYEFKLKGYNAFWQIGAQHQAHSYASTDRLTRTLQGGTIAFDDPSFSTYAASAGVSRAAWEAQLYGENLSNTNAALYSSYAQWVKAETVNRPRTIGLRITYRFGRGSTE